MIVTEEKRTQIISYIVHAGEILQKDNHFPKKTYKYVYLPTWPELYTGVLKAAGYLFLDKNINNIVLLVEQTKYPDKIISYIDDNEFFVWWRNIENKWAKSKLDKQPITLELFEQLLYLRLLTQVKSVTILWVWTKIKKKQIIETIDNIKYTNFWVIILWNSSEEKKIKLSKDEDKKMIEHMLIKKTYKENPNWIGNIYTNIVKSNKWNPELVAYVHSSDLWIRTIHQIWYVCMVA